MKNNSPKATVNQIIDIEDIKTLVRVTVKNWYILPLCLLIAYAASYFYTYKLTAIYGAQTQLVMEDDKINEQSIIGDDYGNRYWWGSNPENVTTMRVIRSYDLIESAVKRLKLGVSYYIVGRIKTTELYNANPYEVIVEALNPNYYEKEIDFKIIDDKNYRLKFKGDTEEKVKIGQFDKEYTDTDVKLVIKNNGITKESAPLLSQNDYEIIIHDTPTIVYRFQQALTVENPEGTNIFQIKVEDVIPERAKAFLDTLTAVFIENSVKTRFQINNNTLNYIDRQMEEITGVLKDIEDSLQSYKERRDILNLNKEEEDYFSKMSTYDERRSHLQMQLNALTALENYIIENKDPQFLPPDIYLSSEDAFLKKGTEDLYNLQIREGRTLGIATDNNYSIIESRQQIELLKKDLLIYIGNSKSAIHKNLADIESQIEYFVSNIKSIPKKQREMLGIQRSLDVNQKMYLFLLEKKSNTIIGKAGIFSQMKILEAARNIGVLRPDKSKIQTIFLIVGAVVGLLIIFLRETFYSKIETISDLKRLTPYPVIGEIIYSSNLNNLTVVVDKESRSPIAESFRAIRTNLQYLSPGLDSKKIVVTSNNPGEGKTFVSLNIAASLAKTGKRTLLIELDLHRPRIQKALNMIADIGISSVLIEKSSTKDAIKDTEIENMSVLLSGPPPPNPSELISSKSLDNVLEYAKNNFDYIVIDTPPVGLISDALVLMKSSDINLFVLNTKTSDKNALNNIHEIISLYEMKNFGFILNGVKVNNSKYYYNRSAGYYGYQDATSETNA